MKRIVSIWFPHFPLDRLKRQVRVEHPGQAARFVDETLPFALVVKDNQALHVGAANQAARQGGVAAGMALADAFALLPGLQTRPLHSARDAAVLKRLARWCVAYAPWTTVDGKDGLLLDITGTARVFGGEDVLLRRLTTRLRGAGFTTHIGVAPTPGAAWALARFGMSKDGADAAVFHGGNAALPAVLGPLPIEALRVTPQDARTLRRLGLLTIADVKALPRVSLARRFSSSAGAATVVTRLDQMFAQQAEPISPLAPAQIFQARTAFSEPVLDPQSFALHLTDLLQRLCQDLALADQGGRALTLVACRCDASRHQITIQTARASADAAHLAKLFEHKLPELDPGFGIDALVLMATRTEPLAPEQSDLKEPDLKNQVRGLHSNTHSNAVAQLMDRLSNRLGAEHVFQLKACASHWPEYAERGQAAGEVPAKSAVRASVNTFVDAMECPSLPPRPLRILTPPEVIDVEKCLPDCAPTHFRWRRVRHHVVRASGPERILPEWWRDGERQTAARDYYDVEDGAGRRFWIFRNHPVQREELADTDQARRDHVDADHRHRDQWRLHGVFA
ncbi:MAG: DNA polymerase Y family protein [Alphaproteobacteria bacterium]|nr:DNA polymerase Y family protein [Alphaproteobacteria bacterium]